MGKHKTRDEWIRLFHEYEKKTINWNDLYCGLAYEKNSKAKEKRHRTIKRKESEAKRRFLIHYKLWKKDDNLFMKNESNKKGRKPKRDIKGFVQGLTREQLEELAEKYIEDQEKSKKKITSKFNTFSKIELAFIFNCHRTNFYKKQIQRTYKFDKHKDKIIEIFFEMHSIFGRERLSAILFNKYNISIPNRTLGRYLNRYNLFTKTRKAKKVNESKNTKVHYLDLVERNFNPSDDNIIASDVTYIPAKSEQNNIYLSIAINHKTKYIEASALSEINDTKLITDTIKGIQKNNFIFHTDHATTYSTQEAQSELAKKNAKQSMSRVGNSLDNREAEYFFSCLKGEYLKNINTWRMTLIELKAKIDWYINWYNTRRIQKRLNWKTPAEARVLIQSQM